MSSKYIPPHTHTQGMDSVTMYPGIASKSKSSYPSLQSVGIVGICQRALQICSCLFCCCFPLRLYETLAIVELII